MTNKQQIFAEELIAIQKRHAIFFPKNKSKHIKMVKGKKGYRLQLPARVKLESQIQMEIELAFKLAIVYGEGICNNG